MPTNPDNNRVKRPGYEDQPNLRALISANRSKYFHFSRAHVRVVSDRYERAHAGQETPRAFVIRTLHNQAINSTCESVDLKIKRKFTVSSAVNCQGRLKTLVSRGQTFFSAGRYHFQYNASDNAQR